MAKHYRFKEALKEVNGLKKQKTGVPRDRIISTDEVELLIETALHNPLAPSEVSGMAILVIGAKESPTLKVTPAIKGDS